ncbi:phosphotransferase [Streptomyces colonosanans]|uniref:Uncharacterized protein n=1 Tax=Streptomyces colonosanans TaxID=1428652 RepID=A0A1S2NZT1_9ACTN|nr:phosphotransferase [Streptomyces colonosanans]OIJ86414.1 hypothetical protein BIV24_26515 [Streptomyces colonosanans]
MGGGAVPAVQLEAGRYGKKGTEALREVAERITPAVREGEPSDLGHIHCDLRREIVIALPGDIIDFDDCDTGHYLLDIAPVPGIVPTRVRSCAQSHVPTDR